MERERVVYDLDGISPARQSFNRHFLNGSKSLARWLARHWLFVANTTNGLIVLGAVLVPYAASAGLSTPVHLVFRSYSLICAQNPARSYFLFGHQMAMDQRMTAIYASMLAAGLVYGFMGRKLRALSLWQYAMAIAPLAVDGFTQLFGWRTSNWELRSITGSLFGVATVWLLYPYLDEVAHEILAANSGDNEDREARLASNG